MKIGGREVVHTTSLIIPSGEDAWIDFHVGGWNVRLHIVFEHSSESVHEQKLNIEPIEDYGKITFINWNNTLGTATSTPVEVGKTQGRSLVFMACHNLVGTANRLEMQFMLESAP